MSFDLTPLEDNVASSSAPLTFAPHVSGMSTKLYRVEVFHKKPMGVLLA